MPRKRPKPQRTGRFDGTSRRDESDEVGLLGGPTSDNGLFEAPDRSPGEMPGLFDAPGQSPGQLPGLFELRRRPENGGAGSPDKPARAAPVGLFDKPPRRKSDSPG